MMGRQRWRGLRDRGAPAAAAGATAGAGDGGIGPPDPGPGGLPAGRTPAGPHPRADGPHDQAASLRDQAASPRDQAVGPRDQAATPPAQRRVPGWLESAASWAWRLLVLGALIYVVFRVVGILRLVVLPCVVALLLTALLQPLTLRLRRSGMPALAATWCTMLAALAVLGGVAALAASRTSADYPRLVTDIGHTTNDLQRWLAGAPFHLHRAGLQELSNHLVTFLKHHESAVAGTVVTGGKLFVELLAGVVLTAFVTFFLLKDGDRIWAWLTSFLGPDPRARARGAGTAAWQALTYYVRGTITVAAIHAVVIGVTLWIMGVPLLIPLVALVFLAAFIPLVGILVAGTIAVAVTLATRGWIAALVLVAVFIVENQLESHLLQPLVVGRMVRFHPLAIILVLAVGGVAGGIAGAVVAVPLAVALFRAMPYLLGRVPMADGVDPQGAVPRAG